MDTAKELASNIDTEVVVEAGKDVYTDVKSGEKGVAEAVKDKGVELVSGSGKEDNDKAAGEEVANGDEGVTGKEGAAGTEKPKKKKSGIGGLLSKAKGFFSKKK